MATDPSALQEPQPLIEAGVTTSEWRLVVRYLQQLAAAGTVALVGYLAARFGLKADIPPQLLDTLVQLELAGGVAIVGYALSRGIRKSGALTPQTPAAPPAPPALADVHPGAGKPATEILGPATAPAAAAAATVAPGGIIQSPSST